MVNPPSFDQLNSLEESSWLSSIKNQMQDNIWPDECARCKIAEKNNEFSERVRANKAQTILKKIKSDYLEVDVAFDNTCNAACFMCHSNWSSLIGKLKGKQTYKISSGNKTFKKISEDRLIKVNITGGEPSVSNSVSNFIKNVPKNVKLIRFNSNGNKTIPYLSDLINKKIAVEITLSVDAIEDQFEKIRYPLKWKKFCNTLSYYKTLQRDYSNLKIGLECTISVLNVNFIDKVIEFANNNDVLVTFSYLSKPNILSITHNNLVTRNALDKYSNSTILDKLHSIATTTRDNTEELENWIDLNSKFRNIAMTIRDLI